MRSLTAYLLIAAMLFALAGCAATNEGDEIMAPFYYRRNDVIFGGDDGVIAQELRPVQDYGTDTMAMLDGYLEGPRAPELKNVFPPNCRGVWMQTDETMTQVCLSKEFGTLEGLDLTIACACLAKTVMEMTGTDTVRILAEDSLLAGAQYVEMNGENLLFVDSNTAETEPSQS